MKPSEKDLIPQIEKALRSALARVPGLKLGPSRGDLATEPDGPDFAIPVSGRGAKRILVVEARPYGQPRFAREASNALARYAQRIPKAYPIFAAPYISEQAAAICETEGIGYIDLAGNCVLKFDEIYIERGGCPNPFSEKRELRSLFSPKATRVLRVLLSSRGRSWKLQDLAKEASVSLGQAFNVKQLLAAREWIREGQDGLILGEPEKLLLEWAQNYTYRKNISRDFFSLQDLPALESSFADACEKRGWRYALTGFSAAARLAPAVRYNRAMVYLGGEIQALIAELNLKEVPSGPNLTILAPYDEGIFYGANVLDGCRIASPVQVYLDLASFRGRGEEAAEVLLERVLRPQWQVAETTTPNS